MKKFIFSILSVVCVFSMIHMNGAWAYELEPDCAAGTCPDAIWDSQLGMYMDCPHGGGVDSNGNQLTCTCFEADYAKWTTYDCACNNDQDCENLGSDGGYCNYATGKCVACVNGKLSCPPSSTTTKDNDCNYHTTTVSYDCHTGCSHSTTYGCYTGGTDSIGTYTCQ